MCVVSTTMPPTVSLAGIEAPFLIICAALFQHPVAGSGTEDHRHFSMYFGVGLGLVRHAVAASTERAYLEGFGAWVDFSVRFGVSVFLDRGIDDMTNAWHLFEYEHTRSLRIHCGRRLSKAICRPSRFFIALHTVFPSKERRARMPKWVIRRPCVSQCRGQCCSLTKL